MATDQAEKRARERRTMQEGERMALMAQSARYLKGIAKNDPVDRVVRLATWRSVQAAQEQLRAASAAAVDRPSDWAVAVEVDQSLDALERAQERALRLGVEPDHPYRGADARSFFRDLYQKGQGTTDQRVYDRLDDLFALGELRGLAPSSSFVPPSFLVTQYADVPRQSRVFGALIPTFPMPKGSTVNLPVLTGGVQVAPVAPNTAPTDGAASFADAFDSHPAGWIAGLLSVSLQMFEQSWNPEFDQVAGEMLTAAFDESVESQLFVGTGTGQQLLGVLNAPNTIPVTYTAGSPTAAGVLTNLGYAVAKYARARKASPTAMFMSPERWSFIATGEDSSSRPLLNVGGPAEAKVPGGTVPVGSIAGVPVYTTTGIPTNLGAGTNQDAIVVTRPEDQRLFVSTPRFAANLDNVANQFTVALTLSASAVAFTDRYPSAVLTGTGLVNPAAF